MRIALVHSFYHPRVPGGENAVVLDEASALQSAGHEVVLLGAHTEELEGTPLYSLRSAFTVATGHGRSPAEQLRQVEPDLVHVHNTFPNWGRAWARDWSGPLVVTVHNYRLFCANAVLYRDGHQCLECLQHSSVRAVRHRCYRNSALATLPLAIAASGGARHDPLINRADHVVALSERQRVMLLDDGVDESRMTVKPNFLPPRLCPAERSERRDPSNARWLFAGQLISEKGALELVRTWPDDAPLDVVGEGPDLAAVAVAAKGKADVRMLGRLPRDELMDLMGGAIGLVFPSRCFEGAPLVYIEALATGLPVLAFSGNVVADAVERDGTGTTVQWGDDLAAPLARAAASFPRLRDHCRRVFGGEYTQRRHLERVEAVYAAAINRAGTREPHVP